MRNLLSKLFGAVYVILEDHDGELSYSRVRFMGPCRMAKRMGLPVRLMPDGRVKGVSFVVRWYPALGDPDVRPTEQS